MKAMWDVMYKGLQKKKRKIFKKSTTIDVLVNISLHDHTN